MAVPSNLTPTQIVTEALKWGGRTVPTSAQITDGLTLYMAAVKSDLHRVAPCHPSLLTQTTVPTQIGLSKYDWPVDAEEISSINLIDTRDETGWTGTAQAGSSSSITLAAGFDNAGIEMRGRYVHNTTPAVTGKGQILTYDNTTKVAGLTTVDGTAFAAATPYMIEAMRWEVKKRTSYHMNAWEQSYELTRPRQMIMRGRTGVFDKAPDRVYIMEWEYWAALDRLDDAGAVFLRHLREWNALYLQGIGIRVMTRFDEDRRNTETQIYNQMLAEYASTACNIVDGTYTDT
jgi:hypothetical protein